MREDEKITPYRMGKLMELAHKVTKQMMAGAWSLTYEEMEIVLKLIQYGVDKSREANERLKKYEEDDNEGDQKEES